MFKLQRLGFKFQHFTLSVSKIQLECRAGKHEYNTDLIVLNTKFEYIRVCARKSMLTDKIRLSGPEATDPEDYFGQSLGVIFPDDITNQHGDIDHSVIYLSPRFGEIKLELADPKGDDNRKLFSHFLWNSGLQLAELIEEGGEWDVKRKKVLELGAGTGLSGLVAAKSGAESVIITDYPAPEVIVNIKKNVEENLSEGMRIGKEGSPATCLVEGHEWGKLLKDDSFV